MEKIVRAHNKVLILESVIISTLHAEAVCFMHLHTHRPALLCVLRCTFLVASFSKTYDSGNTVHSAMPTVDNQMQS